MTRRLVAAAALFAVSLGCASEDDEGPEQSECCDQVAFFAEERTYDTGCGGCEGPIEYYLGEILFFHPNGTVDWLPSGDILYRGSYTHCAGTVSIQVEALGRTLDTCLLVSEDGTHLTSEAGARFDRTQ